MRIYATHCSRKKNDSLKHTGKKVTPDRLYTATPTNRFMNKCKENQVQWAIFSDLYGVWFPDEEHEWYEKDPSRVTPQEFENLLDNFDSRLQGYDEIWFYHNPGRFHPLYQELLQRTKLRSKVRPFTHIGSIV